MRPSTRPCRYTSGLLPTDIGCVALALAPSQTTRGNTHRSRLEPWQCQPRAACPGYLNARRAYLNNAPIHGLADIHLAYCLRILGVSPPSLAPRPHAATPIARDSNLGSGNHDMPRLSKLAYLNDAPIHGLADIQRILGVAPRPSHPEQTHTTPQLWLHKHPHGHQTTYRHAPDVDACMSVSAHPLGRCSLSFSSNTAPALTSECVRWRECQMHKFGFRPLSQETRDSIQSIQNGSHSPFVVPGLCHKPDKRTKRSLKSIMVAQREKCAPIKYRSTGFVFACCCTPIRGAGFWRISTRVPRWGRRARPSRWGHSS
jgi:hypothetical protein